MGGFFGIASKKDCMLDVFFGVDYHSHLGTRRGGMAAWDEEIGLQRKIHNICNANLGTYAICMTGVINNAEELIDQFLSFSGGHFDSMTGGKINQTELLSALINHLIVARDRMGRLPVAIGKNEDGYAAAFESFAFHKTGYEDVCELGPGEIVELRADGMIRLSPPLKEKKICSFLWSYYGYPTSTYEGVNVEEMRYRNGAIMAENDAAAGRNDPIDYVGGVPDSGTPHAIGYANRSGIPFARAFIKYTPTWSRSFMPANQKDRDKIAKMKQIPVNALIKDKNLLFVDDSIVRGTQLRETVEFLYESGAKSVHMRSACPPIMYACKYLNFSRA